ncbi:hypothetical protein [Eupransor demetentiae]|uniref:J domain-containing protein n=1 Tax=Eupransor demetentiae TaxID=3109584 RepID=A0ABP0EU08_9LACO|nr:hypothetical protein R54876_GBNLAHCA_01294 [Lactobacillaceae bacterium LMG 33000]
MNWLNSVVLWILGILLAQFFLELVQIVLGYAVKLPFRSYNLIGFRYDRKTKKLTYRPLTFAFPNSTLMDFPAKFSYNKYYFVALMGQTLLALTWVYVTFIPSAPKNDFVTGWSFACYLLVLGNIFPIPYGYNLGRKLQLTFSNSSELKVAFLLSNIKAKLVEDQDDQSFIWVKDSLHLLETHHELSPIYLNVVLPYLNAAFLANAMDEKERERLLGIYNYYQEHGISSDTSKRTEWRFTGEYESLAILLGQKPDDLDEIEANRITSNYLKRLNYLMHPDNAADKAAYQKVVSRCQRHLGAESVMAKSEENYLNWA